MTCSSRPVSFACNWSAIDLATSLSTEKMSVSLRSKVSAHRCESLAALISCTFTRTASALFCTLPSSFLLRCGRRPVAWHMGDAQLPGDLRQVLRRAFVMLRGCARDHLQISDL